MGASEDARLEILHAHYADTCGVLHRLRGQRDRHFALILVLLAFVLYDIYSPQDFGRLLSDLIRGQGGVEAAPDLRYLGSLLWFALLALVVRYGQTAVLIERQYNYLHAVEDELSVEFGGKAFTREGKAYLSNYPLFGDWAHALYTIIFPAGLVIVVVARFARELRAPSRWGGLFWFDLAVGAAILVSITLYLRAVHGSPLQWSWVRRMTRRERVADG